MIEYTNNVLKNIKLRSRYHSIILASLKQKEFFLILYSFNHLAYIKNVYD